MTSASCISSTDETAVRQWSLTWAVGPLQESMQLMPDHVIMEECADWQERAAALFVDKSQLGKQNATLTEHLQAAANAVEQYQSANAQLSTQLE